MLFYICLSFLFFIVKVPLWLVRKPNSLKQCPYLFLANFLAALALPGILTLHHTMRKSLDIETFPSLTVNMGHCPPHFSEITPITPGTQSFLQHQNDRGRSGDVWDHYIDGSISLFIAGKTFCRVVCQMIAPTVLCCVVCVLCCVWVIPGTVDS